MSKYSTKLSNICRAFSGDKTNITEIISTARPKIFDFEYPLSNLYKIRFETNFLMHYYMREIGQETYALWKLNLISSLNMLAPYYDKLYSSFENIINPLDNIQIKTIHDEVFNTSLNKTSNQEINNNNNVSSTETQKYSDTPQGGLSGLESNEYLTNATITNSSNDMTQDTTSNTQEESKRDDQKNYIESLSGKNNSKSYIELFNQYINNIMSVDKAFINNLSDLFIKLW